MTNNHSIIKISAILIMASLLSPQRIWGQSGSWDSDHYQEDYTASGTTITIANAGQLAKLAAVANDGADFNGITITLSADIDLSAHYWVPIGTATSPFNGTFNGSGYTITGMNINEEGLDNVGLFGYANSASISNLTVSAGTVAGDENVGILAGSLISCNISNCTVSANRISGTRNVSALVGYRDKITATDCAVTGTTAVSLANSANNYSTLSSNQDKPCDVTLTGRTLYKDGKWNTICLPFDYDPAYGVLSGDGVVIYTLTNAAIDGTRLNLYFGDNIAGNGVMRAGVPYIIRWKTTGSDLVDPVFQGVVPRRTAPAGYDNGVSGEERVRLCGTFSQQALDADQSILFMGGSNGLYYPASKINIGAFRAFFLIGDDAEARQLSDFVLNFGEEETTGISAALNDKYEKEDVSGKMSDVWFDLSGRRLANGQRPTAKGLYIYKGKKEVIK